MKKTKQRVPRKDLRNGCSRTQFYFSPKDLLTARSNITLQKDCFIECRFHDPKFQVKHPSGYQFRKRLNGFTTLAELKEAAVVYRSEMERLLDDYHYNPITQKYMVDESSELNPDTDFKSALQKARLHLSGSDKHLNEVRIAINRFEKGIDEMNYSYINISTVKIWHIVNTLDHLKLGPSYFNKFRQYLKDIFKILVQRGCIENNPVREIDKRKVIPKIREIISDEKLPYIDKFLKERHYSFFRYKEIFYRSGSRSSELFRIQKKHVNIEKHEYVIQIQKGSYYKWVTKAINIGSLKYWKELCELCTSEDDYIFSEGLVPGNYSISPSRITHRWSKYVKNTDNIKDENGNVIPITEDFYSWKYLYLDKLDQIQNSSNVIPIDFNIAQTAASHTTDKTTSIYTVGRSKRQLEFLKNIEVG
ncbi:hypothetical protein [Epilithonimonas caeni]|uniref:hypothetical protein n=1 Tax=Epilithonimonas caeni TaxID=365343 RepID=UPI0004202E75|nr:hypothetical protein [Epilithonimonas caeni]